MERSLTVAMILLIPVLVLAQPTFIEHTVSTVINNPIGLHALQIDGDQELELVVGDYLNGIVYTLDGSGDVWVSEQIGTASPGIITLTSGDIDSDGDTDICGAIFSSGQVKWWENDAGVWTEHLIDTFLSARRVALGDIDGDGDLDAVAVSQSQGLFWWENTGGGASWTTHWLFTSGDFWGLALDDMDNDGDLDLVSSLYGSGVIRWHENTDLTWTTQIIVDNLQFPKDLATVDIDGDGLPDVIAAINGGAGQVSWYQNQPDPYWPTELIGNLSGANDVNSADLDGDGDIDVAAAGYSGDSIVWWEKDGFTWIMHTIISGFDAAWNVDIADIDADGDPDIAGVAYGANLIKWWEQEGVPGPVRFDLIPQVTIVPPQGGFIYYDASLVSELPFSIPGLSYWTAVELPNGQLFGPLSRVNFTLQPFQNTYVVALSQSIPDIAPAGQYVFSGYIGNFPVPQLQDSFNFIKEGVGTDGLIVYNPDGWTADTGSWLADSDSRSITGTVTDFQLDAAWPNPFNAQTTLTVALPETSELTVTVFNISGQQVATLAHGQYSAGNHQFNVDGAAFAAGMYFVNAHVPGKLNQTRKILLVK